MTRSTAPSVREGPARRKLGARRRRGDSDDYQTGHPKMTEKQVEANRRNALQSTGPRTPEGVAKLQAERLPPWASSRPAGGPRREPARVGDPPGRDRDRPGPVTRDRPWPNKWPRSSGDSAGWSVSRSDLIVIAQAEDELLRAHETIHERGPCPTRPKRTDIPTRDDVTRARHAAPRRPRSWPTPPRPSRQLQALASMARRRGLAETGARRALREDFHPIRTPSKASSKRRR